MVAKLNLYSIGFLLFLLPLFFLLSGPYPYESPKVLLAEIVIEGLVVLNLLFNKKLLVNKSGNFLLVLLLSLTALSALHLFVSQTDTLLLGNAFRLQGTFLLWHLLLFCYISSFISINQVVTKLGVVSLAGLGITTLLFGYNPSGRAIGTLGEPNMLGASAVIVTALLLFANNKTIRLLAVACSVVIVWLTKSQSAALALALELLFFFVTQLTFIRIRWATAMCLFLLFFSFSMPFLFEYQKTVQEGPMWQESRRDIWLAAIEAGKQKPLVGWGFGNTEYALHDAAAKHGINIWYQYVDSAHNMLLDWWVQGGIIGLGLLAFLISSAFRRFLSQNNKREVTLLLGLLTVLSFNPASITALVWLWWVLGKGVITSIKSNKTK